MEKFLQWAWARRVNPMFEKYTEPARRVLFYARYEASQYGCAKMETEHLLLGLIQADGDLLRRTLPDPRTIAGIREQISKQVEIREKTSTSVDIPLSEECVRILGYASEGSIVDTRNILLGILREEKCLAAKTLAGLGLRMIDVREELSRTPTTPAAISLLRRQHQTRIPETALPVAGVVPDADTAKRVAEAVWAPRMSGMPSENIVARNATLTLGVWIVTGSGKSKGVDTSLGAFIQKEDGSILRLHIETPGS